MTIRGPFEPDYKDLPSSIPVFPLTGALLLPGGTLPLNIFEPKYITMVKDAIADPLRLIGMIQPNKEQPTNPLLFSGVCREDIKLFGTG